MFAGHCYAETHRINPKTDFKKPSKEAKAGDSIVLENGTWNDVELKLASLSGTKDSPISIVAETPGKVILTGKSRVRLSGQHVIVSGLVLRDCTNDKDVFETRTDKETLGKHFRITQCVFDQTCLLYTSPSPRD